MKFDNLVLRTLPLDKEMGKGTRAVPGACFSLVEPTPVENPEVVAHSKSALALLGVKEEDIEETTFAEYFSGNKLFNGSQPAAHCYCGHQFGYFSGQLGDGAAIYLGEIINDRNERWELQLKGAGMTPYSRHADGRKVLRSSIREFLCSEAMHYLGVPTTRAGTCVSSDSRVVRDMFYDGHPQMERCTIVSRIAPTFIRFGSFEIFKDTDPQTGRKGPSTGRVDILEKMLEYVITMFFPEIASRLADDKRSCYLDFYKEVVRRTARLVALWQCVGFCHGVLNTDNMSILGLTIDYGPYGFMDYFDPHFICNSSDNQGRYTYVKQPEICKWNLVKFAEALQDVLPIDESKTALNEIYDTEFSSLYFGRMMKKLGISKHENNEKDEELVQKLLWTMQRTSADFTNTFRLLSSVSVCRNNISDVVPTIVAQCQSVEEIKKKFRNNVNMEQIKTLLRIAEVQPNLIAQLGMTREQIEGLLEKAEKEKEICRMTPEEKTEQDRKLWTKWLTAYRERLQAEVSGLLEDEITKFEENRKKIMNSVNPRVILRNYLAQEAIASAEEGDYTKVRELLRTLESPYDGIQTYTEGEEEKLSETTMSCKKYSCAVPSWAADLRVS